MIILQVSFHFHLRISSHSEFRQGKKEAHSHTHTRLSKGRSRWREETASLVFAPDKSTSRSAFKNVVICVYIRARAPAGLACACPVVQERAIIHRDGGFRGYVGLNDQKEAYGPAVTDITSTRVLFFTAK